MKFPHLDNLGVVVHTAALEGFLNLKPCLGDGALLDDWLVVRILAGHLEKFGWINSTRFVRSTFSSPVALRSRVETRS